MKLLTRFVFFLIVLSVNGSALWAMNEKGNSIRPCLKRGREGEGKCSPSKRLKTVVDDKENQKPEQKPKKNVTFNACLATTYTFFVADDYWQVKQDRLKAIAKQLNEPEESEEIEEQDLDEDKPNNTNQDSVQIRELNTESHRDETQVLPAYYGSSEFSESILDVYGDM